MDLNYLYRQQQMSLMQADAAASPEARAAHLGRADAYGSLIEHARHNGGLPARFDAAGRSLGQVEPVVIH